MTMVTKRVSAKQRMQRLGDKELVVAVDADSMQLLAYEDQCFGAGKEAAHVRLETQLLKGRRSVQLRTNLMDCHIDICAPEVSERARGGERASGGASERAKLQRRTRRVDGGRVEGG